MDISFYIDLPKGYKVTGHENCGPDKIKLIIEKEIFKPKSWKELIDSEYYKNRGKCCINGSLYPLPSQHEYGQAILALMQLISLRQAWVGDWEPDWRDHNQLKSVILLDSYKGKFEVVTFRDLTSRPLSFPTKEMAEEFLDCFKDLIEQAKELI